MPKSPKKKVKKSKNIDSDGINYKKLFFELMSVLAIVFGVSIAVLYPYINAKLKERDPYERFRSIITRVDEYDYSKGRDTDLEKELDNAVKEARSDAQSHFYVLASGIYYCNVKMYRLAYDAFEWLDVYGLQDDEEVTDVEARRVLCQRKAESDGKNDL